MNSNAPLKLANSAAQEGGRRKTRKAGKTSKSRKAHTMKAHKVPAVGSRAQVYHGHAKHTSGGLTKSDLVMNKHGRIVSRRKMTIGKKIIKNLYKAGYKPKKGTFKLFKKH